MTTELRVPDATCGHCKSTIEAAVLGAGDVSRADLDLESKRLLIEHGDGVSAERFINAIRAAGYTPEPAA